VVVLNTFDPQSGEPLNQVKDAPVKVGLSDVPNSPAYRMQEQQQLGDIIRALAPNPTAVAILSPAFIEGSSHPDRQRLADDLRRATGQPTAGDRQAQAAQSQQVQAVADATQQLQMRGAAAKVAKDEAEVQRTQALAERERAQARQIATQTVAATAAAPAANEDSLIQQALDGAQV
jgi:hypothetical protein